MHFLSTRHNLTTAFEQWLRYTRTKASAKRVTLKRIVAASAARALRAGMHRWRAACVRHASSNLRDAIINTSKSRAADKASGRSREQLVRGFAMWRSAVAVGRVERQLQHAREDLAKQAHTADRVLSQQVESLRTNIRVREREARNHAEMQAMLFYERSLASKTFVGLLSVFWRRAAARKAFASALSRAATRQARAALDHWRVCTHVGAREELLHKLGIADAAVVATAATVAANSIMMNAGGGTPAPTSRAASSGVSYTPMSTNKGTTARSLPLLPQPFAASTSSSLPAVPYALRPDFSAATAYLSTPHPPATTTSSMTTAPSATSAAAAIAALYTPQQRQYLQQQEQHSVSVSGRPQLTPASPGYGSGAAVLAQQLGGLVRAGVDVDLAHLQQLSAIGRNAPNASQQHYQRQQQQQPPLPPLSSSSSSSLSTFPPQQHLGNDEESEISDQISSLESSSFN